MSENFEKTIAGYQLIEQISMTDNAIVFKAYQASTDRYVAVKVLKPSVTRDPSAVQAFLQQANLAAQFQHPNILPVYDSGQDEGAVYQVTEYVETGVLSDHLNAFYNPQLALSLFNGLVGGLEYIHNQGYIHANIKSSNIFLDESQRPLLADFGASPLAEVSPSAYRAPEQVQGGVIDRRTDVYALGILLYEVLVGGLPPTGMMISPRANRPDLPEALERVILKAVAQNPDQRFQNLHEFQSALSSAVQQSTAPSPEAVETPTSAAPAGVSQNVHVEQPKGTNWMAIILGILLLGIVCVGAFVIIPRFLGDAEQTPDAIQPPIETAVENPTPEPKPTDIPEQPTEPPLEPIEPPAGELPPGEGLPGERPPGDIGNIIGEICGSIRLLFAAAVLYGGVSLFNQKSKPKR